MFNLSKLIEVTNAIEDTTAIEYTTAIEVECKVCQLTYDKNWCTDICFFCENYNPWYHTYETILMSKTPLEYLHKWCDKFKINKPLNIYPINSVTYMC